jgi:hypothetical protein
MAVLAQLWKPIGLMLLLAAALGYRALLIHERDAARAQAAHLQSALTEAQAANTAMRNAVTAQNAAVARLSSKLKQSADEAAARERSAATESAAVMRRASEDARALVRARMGSGCAAAIRWGNAESAELARW